MAPNITISKNNKTITDDTEFTIGDSLTVTISKSDDEGTSTIEIFDHKQNRRFYSRRLKEHIFSTVIPYTSVFGEWMIEILVKSISGEDISQQFPLNFTASTDKAVTEQISQETTVDEPNEEMQPSEGEIVEIPEHEQIMTESNNIPEETEAEEVSELAESLEDETAEKIEESIDTGDIVERETDVEDNEVNQDKMDVKLPAVEPQEEMTVEPTEVAFEEVIREETPLEEEEEEQLPEQPKEVAFEEYIHEGEEAEPTKLEPEEIEYDTIPDFHEEDGEDYEINDEESDYEIIEVTEENDDEIEEDSAEEEYTAEEPEEEELEPEIEEPVIVSLNDLTFEEQQAALEIIETPEQLDLVQPVVLTETQKNDLEIPLAELDEIETRYYNNLKASEILYISHLLERKPAEILEVSKADVLDVSIWLQRGLFILSNPEHGLRREYRKIRSEYLEYQRQLERLMESPKAKAPLSELISVNETSITRLNEEGIETVGQLLQHQLIDLMNLDIDPEKPLLPKLWIANAKSYLAII